MVRNLFVVWLLTGIWHGAEWTFILWGLYNFVFITFEKLISYEKIENHNIFKHIYVLFVINLGWVIFRAPDLYSAGNYISAMFGFAEGGIWSSYTWMFIKENSVFFLLGILLSMPIVRKINKQLVDKRRGSSILTALYPISMVALFIVCISYLIKGTYSPFIYFNF